MPPIALVVFWSCEIGENTPCDADRDVELYIGLATAGAALVAAVLNGLRATSDGARFRRVSSWVAALAAGLLAAWLIALAV